MEFLKNLAKAAFTLSVKQAVTAALKENRTLNMKNYEDREKMCNAILAALGDLSEDAMDFVSPNNPFKLQARKRVKR